MAVDQSVSALSPALVSRVRGVVPSCVDWLVQQVAVNAEVAYTRANTPRPMRYMRKPISERLAVASVSAPETEAMDMSPQIVMNMDDEVDFDFSDGDADDEIPDDDYPNSPLRRPHVFSPTAASTSTNRDNNRAEAGAEQLAISGRNGHGLFLVLHADDIHSTQELLVALREFLGTSNYYTVS